MPNFPGAASKGKVVGSEFQTSRWLLFVLEVGSDGDDDASWRELKAEAKRMWRVRLWRAGECRAAHGTLLIQLRILSTQQYDKDVKVPSMYH